MSKGKDLKTAQKEVQDAVDRVNRKISELGENTSKLYDSLNEIQNLFDVIRNMPSEQRLEYERLKQIRLNWKSAVEKINAKAKTEKMGMATVLGVASAGVAISTLSGAAATNAVLVSVLGGGSLTAAPAILALAGPVGWAIAGVAVLSSGLLISKSKSEQKRLEGIFTLISKRDVKFYNLALVELNERIVRINEESRKLVEAISRTKSFGTDYNMMTEHQQYELGSYVNLMNASTQLLVNPIEGLKPKFTKADYSEYVDIETRMKMRKYKDIIISMSNLLYSIPLDEKDRKLLYKSFKKNKEFLKSAGISKEEFNQTIIDVAYRVATSK